MCLRVLESSRCLPSWSPTENSSRSADLAKAFMEWVKNGKYDLAKEISACISQNQPQAGCFGGHRHARHGSRRPRRRFTVSRHERLARLLQHQPRERNPYSRARLHDVELACSRSGEASRRLAHGDHDRALIIYAEVERNFPKTCGSL